MTVTFKEKLKENNIQLKRHGVKTLQINVGNKCNQACLHCHVEASPSGTNCMTKETADRIVALLKNSNQVNTVDITGGAPELNPNFRYLVSEINKLGKNIIDRCNLTVLFEEGQEGTPQFLKDNDVQIVASLPCYLEDNVDGQRGKGVFDKSIKALKLLNEIGYGKEGTGLILNLVYNPTGENLPPSQGQLEEAYKKHLKQEFSIEFNNLFTITNMPIKRFADLLKKKGKDKEYMQLLIDSFNPCIAQDAMCTELISIGWDGQIYDCDFNQVLEIPINGKQQTIWDVESFGSVDSGIAVDDHCFGCTAGSGSSCKGSLEKK